MKAFGAMGTYLMQGLVIIKRERKKIKKKIKNKKSSHEFVNKT